MGAAVFLEWWGKALLRRKWPLSIDVRAEASEWTVRVCQAGARPGQGPAGRTGRVGRPWLQERVREEQVRRHRALGAVAGRGFYCE